MKLFLFGKSTIEVLRMELTRILYILNKDLKSLGVMFETTVGLFT